MQHVIEEFLHDISNITTLDALTEHFQTIVGREGFHSLTMGLMPWQGNGGDTDQAVLISTLDDDFQHAYNEMDAHTFDPMFEEMAKRYLPCTKSSLRPLYDKSPQGRDIVELAEDYHVGEGLMIPLSTTEYCRGVALFADESEASFQKRLHEYGPTYQYLAAHFAARAEELGLAEICGPTIHLTTREQECLQWVAAGKTSQHIATVLGIAEVTVNFHIYNICKKFGVERRSQAVLRALNLGLIQL